MEVKRLEGSFVNGRGQRLHTLTHLPTELPRALLMFHHGYGEHSGRYQPGFEWLAQAGVAVHTYDAHGHGRSEPNEERDRHLIWDFQDMVDDWSAYCTQVAKEYPAGLPRFIGGHSMGALTSILVALQDQAPWEGLVCCSATVDVEWNWFLRLQASLGGILAVIVPRAKIVPAVNSEDMSADPAAVQEMEDDPLNSSGNVRARTANEFLKAFRRVFEHEHELRLPIYAHHGSCDRLANLSAVRRMLKNVQSRDVTLHVLEGGFHEVMMGAERQDATQRIVEWIHAKVAEGAPQAAPIRGLPAESAEPAEASLLPDSPRSPSRRSSGDSSTCSTPECRLSATSSLSSDDSSLSSAVAEDEQPVLPRQPLPQLRAGLGAGPARPVAVPPRGPPAAAPVVAASATA